MNNYWMNVSVSAVKRGRIFLFIYTFFMVKEREGGE